MFHEAGYSEEQQMIAQFVAGLSKDYDNAYFLTKIRKLEYPSEFWNVLVENGFLGLEAPDTFGGSGFGHTDLVVFLNQIAKAGMASYQLIDQLLAARLILDNALAAQQKQYLPELIAGKRWSLAFLDDVRGRSLDGVAVRAAKKGKGYALTGRKFYAVNAKDAERLLVTATVGAGRARKLGLFVVDPKAKGVKIVERQINIRVNQPREPMAVTGDVFYNVELKGVTAEALLGKLAPLGVATSKIAARQMLMLAATAVGWGDRILDKAIAYANTRVIYQEPIGAYQAIQHPLVRAKTDVEMAKLLIERAVAAYQAEAPAKELLTYAAVAKYAATEAAYNACDIGIQTHGGGGYDRDTGLITLWPLILQARIVPLNSEVILENFADEVVLAGR